MAVFLSFFVLVEVFLSSHLDSRFDFLARRPALPERNCDNRAADLADVGIAERRAVSDNRRQMQLRWLSTWFGVRSLHLHKQETAARVIIGIEEFSQGAWASRSFAVREHDRNL